MANGVYVNGTFNGWNGTSNPMDDSDGDGVYTLHFLRQPSFETNSQLMVGLIKNSSIQLMLVLKHQEHLQIVSLK